ncbi:hypothetical protein [Neosynechococcus sphagnicola]|nr:hypothetical protein [Neosynechococcus sphagnicola]
MLSSEKLATADRDRYPAWFQVLGRSLKVTSESLSLQIRQSQN